MEQLSLDRPFETYTPPKRNDFEGVVQSARETQPLHYELLKKARYLCHRFKYVDADLLRNNFPELFRGVDKRIIGTVLNKKNFDFKGYFPSETRTSHGRPIGRWELKKD